MISLLLLHPDFAEPRESRGVNPSVEFYKRSFFLSSQDFISRAVAQRLVSGTLSFIFFLSFYLCSPFASCQPQPLNTREPPRKPWTQLYPFFPAALSPLPVFLSHTLPSFHRHNCHNFLHFLIFSFPPSNRPSVSPSVCLPVQLSARMSVCLPVYLRACLYVCLSARTHVSLSVSLHVCQSVMWFWLMKFLFLSSLFL